MSGISDDHVCIYECVNLKKIYVYTHLYTFIHIYLLNYCFSYIGKCFAVKANCHNGLIFLRIGLDDPGKSNEFINSDL